VCKENLILIGVHVGRSNKSEIELSAPLSYTRDDGIVVFKYNKNAPTIRIEVPADLARALLDEKSKLEKDRRTAGSRELVFKLEIDKCATEGQFKGENQ